MNRLDLNRHYMDRWFWTLGELVERVGGTRSTILEHVRVGCAPGPIYINAADGTWWSALDRTPPPDGHCWYSPGAAWPLRRALLAKRNGATPAEAAHAERAKFTTDFVAILGIVEGAKLAFPGCFDGDRVDPQSAAAQAAVEWESWIRGGYGVCLRVFNAQTCIQKEVLRALLLRGLEEDSESADQMLRQAEALAGLILPFAPWQRATGTPGLTIDRLLGTMELGSDLDWAGADVRHPPLRCSS